MFRSFLSNGYFIVELFGEYSDVFISPSGVPQGGHLSPLVFSLFVNGTSKVLNQNKILCFADEMKLFMHINSPDGFHKLQSDFNYFDEWSQSLDSLRSKAAFFFNKMIPHIFHELKLHIKKCIVLFPTTI